MRLTSITLPNTLDESVISKIDKQAFITFSCAGKHTYTLEEEEVDRILGGDAFCGGELSEKHFNQLEEALEAKQSPTYFWPSRAIDEIGLFTSFLSDQNINYEYKEFEEVDWNKKWRDAFDKIIVNNDCRIIPSWQKKEKSNLDLFIYPGMGFGTGNHETTYLCLQLYYQIRDELKPNLSCLDFGCGSGILGIAPMKDKDANVCFVDIDTAALDNCVMNLELNDHIDYKGTKEVVLRDRIQFHKYDLVFANILEHVLIDERDIIMNSLNENAYLIVSGLLNDQVENIKKVYSHLKPIVVKIKGDWSAVLFQKK